MEQKPSFSAKILRFVLLLVTLIIFSLSAVFAIFLFFSVKDSFFGVTSGFAYYLLRSHHVSEAISKNNVLQVEKEISTSLELQEEILYVALINNDGKIILDSTGGDVGRLYKEDTKHQWLTKDKKEKFFFLRNVTLRNKTFDVANVILPIYQKGEVWGVGIVGVAANYLFKHAFPRIAVFIGIMLIIFLLVTALVTVSLIHALFKPVRELISATERIFEQDFEFEIPDYGDDELGKLGGSFNRLISYLKDFISRLQGQSMIEPLTQCYQESFFYKQLVVELERSHRYHDPLCAGWLEIHNFASLADQYGQDFGKLLLKSLADILRQSTRRIDILAYGKNHRFGLILPKTDSEGVQVVIQRIHSAARQLSFARQTNGQVQYMDFNYGLVVSEPEEGLVQVSVENILKKAENVLEYMKQQGPNLGAVVPYYET